MANRKDCFALLSRFESKSKKLGITVPINRYAEQWAADALLDSFEKELIHEVMDYYFEIKKEKARWTVFARQFSRLLDAKNERDRDEKERFERRERLREILNER